ncbi:MAG: hypothetical protein KDB53_04635, partial [Planctomycetes bacterium]|nr:hypothetical protein [Planctomycetota bacterium]
MTFGDHALIPAAIVDSLQSVTGADTITIYLSSPAAPHERASYVLLACRGIVADHAAEMWGPLPHASLAVFSASDTKKRRVISDVTAKPPFSTSRFARQNAIKSLARLSIRLPIRPSARPQEPDPVAGVIPPFLEVFLSYREPRTEVDLEALATRANHLLLGHAADILDCQEIKGLVDPRQVGIRARRLERVSDRFKTHEDTSLRGRSGRRRLRRSVEECFDALCGFMARELGIGVETPHSISVHAVERWHHGEVPEFDVYPVHATPFAPREALHQRLRSGPRPGVCRFVAAHETSVVLDVRDLTVGWEKIYIPGDVRGLSITFPLFHGALLFGVINVEVEWQDGIVGRLQQIWQVLPTFEELVFDSFRRLSAVDDAVTLSVIKSFSSFPLRPRRKAIKNRLRRLRSMFELQACSLATFVDDGEAEVVGSQDASPRVSVRIQAKELARVCAAVAALSEEGDWSNSIVALGLGQTAQTHAYRFQIQEQRESSVRRRAIESNDRSTKVLRSFLSTSGLLPDASGDMVLMPIEHKMMSPSDGAPRFDLLMVFSSAPGADLSRSRLERLLDIRDAMASALAGVDRIQMQTTLFAWATAGIGSIHDVVNALGRSSELLREDPTEDEIVRVADLLVALRNQLALLDGLARQKPATRSKLTTVAVAQFVERIVYESSLLAGHSQRPVQTTVDDESRQIRVSVAQKERLLSVLSNVIANSFKYGAGGAPTVHASIGRDNEMTIVVRNQAYRELYENALESARQTASRVQEENAAEVLYSILRNKRSVASLQGIGIWLTARIVKEILQGRFVISYAVSANDATMLDVEC